MACREIIETGISRSHRRTISNTARVMYYISFGNAQFQEFRICGFASEIPSLCVLLTRVNWTIEDFVDDWISRWQIIERCIYFVSLSCSFLQRLVGSQRTLDVRNYQYGRWQVMLSSCLEGFVYSREGSEMLFQLQFGGQSGDHYRPKPAQAISDSSVSKEKTKILKKTGDWRHWHS